ncbi:MAG: amidohydrolase family protein [Phycisphaerae bacterium]
MKFMHSLTLTAFAGVLVSAGTADAKWPALKKEVSVIKAGRYLAPDGSIKKDALIRIKDGTITGVGKSDESFDARLAVEYPDAVVSPGLIDVDVKVGVDGYATETIYAVDPDASTVESVDWNHDQLRQAVRAGITTVMVTPTPNNVVGGAAAVIKTSRAGSTSEVLRDGGPLMFALGSSTWSYDRSPTSRIGGLAILRDALEQAAEGKAHPRLNQFASGKLDGMVVCEKAMDVSSALRLFHGAGQSIIVRYTGQEHDLSSELSSMSRAFVTGPLTTDMQLRTMGMPGALAAKGVPVVFTSGIPDGPADGLRMSASLAARHGMDAKQARRAITILPAIAAGVSDRVGSIYKGLDADFVVFSDDPLRLDARVLAVYVGGVCVYDASIQQE